jgi:hypothetical protein
MFLLYVRDGSGSREVRLVERVPVVHWGLIKRNVVRIVRDLLHDGNAAEMLETMPFELWKATNGYGDAFEVLYMRVPTATYLAVELESDSYHQQASFRNIAEAMAEGSNPVRFIAMDVDPEDAPTVSTPQLQITSVAVIRALSDFEVLVSSSGGPVSGVDRIHTAFHGYLQAVCDDEGIQHPAEADITSLFTLIRNNHPKFLAHPPGAEAMKILRGLAQVVDALNPVRNDHSMAHPNPDLLDEPEAFLAVNAVKTLLHYLNMKLS